MRDGVKKIIVIAGIYCFYFFVFVFVFVVFVFVVFVFVVFVFHVLFIHTFREWPCYHCGLA